MVVKLIDDFKKGSVFYGNSNVSSTALGCGFGMRIRAIFKQHGHNLFRLRTDGITEGRFSSA